MNTRIKTRELVISGLLLATGILIPILFHFFSMSGSIFLPMHIPVLIGGFLLSPSLALCLGIVTPILSGLLTGMPVLFPMSIIMAFELGTYGLLASLLTIKLKLNLYLSLILSMIAGRISAGLIVALLVQIFGVKMNPILFVKGAIATGLIGIIIQVIIIPPIILALRNHMKKSAV